MYAINASSRKIIRYNTVKPSLVDGMLQNDLLGLRISYLSFKHWVADSLPLAGGL